MDPIIYYTDPRIAAVIVDECKHRLVMVRTESLVVRRHYDADAARRLIEIEAGRWPSAVNTRPDPFIEIHRASDKHNPTSVEYHATRGVVEFIPEVTKVWDLERAPVVCIDLDPKTPLDYPVLKSCVEVVVDVFPDGWLCAGSTVIDRKLRFSGNRSFHIWLAFEKPVKLSKARDEIRARLLPLCQKVPILTLDSTSTGRVVYLDINTIAKHRCVRSLYSLHAKTMKCCVPVADLNRFEIDEARPEAVLERGPQAERF